MMTKVPWRASVNSIAREFATIRSETEAKARADEREECAQIADLKNTYGFDNGFDIACVDIAAAIRARTTCTGTAETIAARPQRGDKQITDKPEREEVIVAKTIEENFIDWEAHVFGYGYGTGEEHTVGALKEFLAILGTAPGRLPHGYWFEDLEAKLSPTTTWLMINILCNADIIEYGTSPRGGWLTRKGEALKAFVDAHSAEQLVELCAGQPEGYISCFPDGCNCGPNGYEEGRHCPNPFWDNQ